MIVADGKPHSFGRSGLWHPVVHSSGPAGEEAKRRIH
jgi:hypothetical protein